MSESDSHERKRCGSEVSSRLLLSGRNAHHQKGPTRRPSPTVTALVAQCHLGLGKLYQRTGHREQAQEHLTTATTMYREMGMTYWLEQAERVMTELR